MSDGKKATAVITYNSVESYPAGVYEGKNGKVIVCSNANTKTWGSRDAPQRLREVLHTTGEISPENTKKVFLYVGLYAIDGAISAATELAREGCDLELVACGCDWDYKRRVARQINAPLRRSECGGLKELGRIVDELMYK